MAASHKVIACATTIEEMPPLLPEATTYDVLDFELHLIPPKLRNDLQETIPLPQLIEAILSQLTSVARLRWTSPRSR